MPHVSLADVSVELAVYNSRGRALKSALLSRAVGGRLDNTTDPGVVVVAALRGITLNVADGERVGVIGGNGSGKTTLLRVLSGVYAPTSGVATIDGHASSLIDLTMGMDPEATGYENIVMRGIMLGLSRKEANGLIDDVAAFSQLGEYLALPIRTYSSGMLLRLAFAVCTSVNSEILIFDEIIGVGDAAFAERAQKRLDSLIERSNIMFLATHDNTMIERFCNRVLWIQEGRIRLDGRPTDVLAAYAELVNPAQPDR